MNYSELLLKQIRELNGELARIPEPASPDECARRDELLQALAWYVHKLQLRVLQMPRSGSVSPAAIGDRGASVSARGYAARAGAA